MALEHEAQLLKQAVQARLLDPEKGTAALAVYSQLMQMGAKFTFGEFLVERGLIAVAALHALESGKAVRAVSKVGDFEIIGLLGEGQCGTVYRARQKSLDRFVALKILNFDVTTDPDAVRRFQQEARSTARFSHPNIVQGIVTGTDQGLHYFAMELVDGGSARSMIDSAEEPIAEDTALEIARQAAVGLTAAHVAGFVHRDVKPDNILITQDGQVKLVDLGISQLAAHHAVNDGEFWASPPYVAPEIIGGQPADSRSDVYSLGATLFELLTGKPPFSAEKPDELFSLHLSAPVPDVRTRRPDVRYETASLVHQMLAKNPLQRIQSAAIVAETISRILSAAPVETPAAATKPRPVSRTLHRPKLPTSRPRVGRRRYKPRRG